MVIGCLHFKNYKRKRFYIRSLTRHIHEASWGRLDFVCLSCSLFLSFSVSLDQFGLGECVTALYLVLSMNYIHAMTQNNSPPTTYLPLAKQMSFGQPLLWLSIPTGFLVECRNYSCEHRELNYNKALFYLLQIAPLTFNIVLELILEHLGLGSL